MVKQAYLWLFLIFLIVSPIHLFESGLPQPGDCLMALLILILLTGFILRPPIHKDLYMAASFFVGYVALVSLVWWSQLDNPNIALPALYFAFNVGALIVVVSLIREFQERSVTAFRVGLGVALVLQITALLLLPAPGIRPVGTFNNPNQLGYWGLLVGVCILVLKREQRLGWLDLLMLAGAGFLVAHSLSKGAMLSFGLLMLLAAAFQGFARSIKGALLALAFVSATIAFAESSVVDRFLSYGLVGKVADRLDNIGDQADDSLAGRGYDRIWRYPEHLVFGAGEGAAWRFSHSRINPHLDQKEMHSTLGTVLFSYGMIGFFLFLAFLFVVFRQAPLAHLLYSLPIWAYGMTHQGLRESMLWVFFGMVFGLAHFARSAAPLAVSGGHPVVERGPGVMAASQASRLRASRLNTAEAPAIDR